MSPTPPRSSRGGRLVPRRPEEILREVGEAFEGSASREDLLALAGAIVGPTKWGLYDRDALETWVQGTKTPRNNAFPKRSAKVCDHCCVPPDRAGRPRFRGLLGQEDARHQMVPKNPHRFSPRTRRTVSRWKRRETTSRASLAGPTGSARAYPESNAQGVGRSAASPLSKAAHHDPPQREGTERRE
jgi:hypothetical protein